MSSYTTKLSLLLRPGLGLPHHETLWAERIDDRHLRLLMSSFYVPLSVGDVVEAAHDQYDSVTIVGVCEPALTTLAMVRACDYADPQDVQALSRRWLDEGALWAEVGAGGLNTAWSPATPTDHIITTVRDDLDALGGWLEPRVYEPSERTTRSLQTWARVA